MEFYEKVFSDILRCGRNIVGVGGVPTFAYTIGNHQRGQAELLIFCVNFDSVGNLLNDLSDRFVDGFPNEFKYPGASFPIRFKLVTEKAHKNYTFQIEQFFQTENIPVYQVVIPDQQGYFPDDPRCAKSFARQPLLWLDGE